MNDAANTQTQVPAPADADAAATVPGGVIPPPVPPGNPPPAPVPPGTPPPPPASPTAPSPVPPVVAQLAQDTAQIAGQAASEISAAVQTATAAAQKAAAEELAAVYRALPGVAAALVSGDTVEEVKASYAAARSTFDTIKQQVLRELGAALPSGHGGGVPAPAPTTPLGLIAAGLQQK